MYATTSFRLAVITGIALCLFAATPTAEARKRFAPVQAGQGARVTGKAITDPTGERFAPVTLQAGQGARVTITNVLIPAQGTAAADCPVLVRFFDAKGALSSTLRNKSI